MSPLKAELTEDAGRRGRAPLHRYGGDQQQAEHLPVGDLAQSEELRRRDVPELAEHERGDKQHDGGRDDALLDTDSRLRCDFGKAAA